MENTEYGVRNPEPRNLLPEISLLMVPHKGRKLICGHPAFGPNFYSGNLESMGQSHYHSNELPEISFKPSTTSESVSASAYEFGTLAKPQILDRNWLQLGPIVRTSLGVFVNIKEVDESVLKSLLNKCEKVNGIWLYNGEDITLRDFGFAEYETFKQGVQDSGDFAEGGLARILEHTPKKSAPNLRKISSTKFYPRGVEVFGFDKVKVPILRVACLISDRDLVDVRLDVYGDYSVDDGYGYAFGVRNADAEGVAQKITN